MTQTINPLFLLGRTQVTYPNVVKMIRDQATLVIFQSNGVYQSNTFDATNIHELPRNRFWKKVTYFVEILSSN